MSSLLFPDIINWLTSSAGVGWVVAIISSISWIVREITGRRPSALVAIEQVDIIRLLDITPSYKNKIKVLYTDDDGQEYNIQDLQQTELVIYNKGNKDITEDVDIKINVKTDEKPPLLKLLIENSTNNIVVSKVENSDKSTTFNIKIPFLNSKKHNQKISAHLLSSHSAEIESVAATGKGWSSHFSQKSQAIISIKKFLTLALFILSITILSVIIIKTI
jgi:hypothetical protein